MKTRFAMVLFFVLLVTEVFSQTGWNTWQKLYSDNNITVEVQFFYSGNSCIDGGRPFKYKYKLNGLLSQNIQYVTWKINYINCNAAPWYEQVSLAIGGPEEIRIFGKDKLVEMVIYDPLNNKFICSSLVEPFYEVNLSSLKTSESGPAAITLSKAPTEIEGQKTLVFGLSTSLSVKGGLLAKGAQWVWYKDQCGVTKIGAGISVVVQPTETTMYFVRAEGINNITGCAKTTIVIDKRCTLALENGNKLFLQGKYEEALAFYNEVLSIDSKNKNALSRIKEINDLLEIQHIRNTTIFSYKEINPDGYRALNSEISAILNRSASNSKEGMVKFNYSIDFDKKGGNNSSFWIYNTSDLNLKNELNLLKKLPGFTAPTIKKIYVASKQNLDFELSWKTQSLTYRLKHDRIYSRSKTQVQTSLFEDYIRGTSSCGKFEFEVKEKTINNLTYLDVMLVSYKATAGPMSCFYSMLLPGIGTLRVTQGQKGWKQMAFFVATAGTSIASRYYSNAKYNQYLVSTTQESMDNYYKKANFTNRLSIVAGGIATSIYIYDILWVLSKGIKNNKHAQILINQLKHASPINIQNQSMDISALFDVPTKAVTSNFVVGSDYEGGIIFYLLQPDDAGYDAKQQHGLIAAPSDQSTGIQWYNRSDYTTTGATATALGTGKANTFKIVNSQGAGIYAAKLCSDLVLGGFSDWYLPSKDELNKLYENKNVVGGFATKDYWSSSETNNYGAWGRDFDVGFQDKDDKSANYCVRAVRAF